MIKKLITMRANYLLNEIDQIISAYNDIVVNAQNELSPIKRAMETSIPPKDMKRIRSIMDQLQLMQGMFGEEKK
jgi:predicted transcriptional regulator